MNILFFNAILYTAWAVFGYKKQRGLSVYTFILLLYAVISILGFYCVYSGLYESVYHVHIKHVDLFPYVLCFFVYVILFHPFKDLSMCEKQFPVGILFSGLLRKIVAIWAIYYTLYTVLKLFEAQVTIITGLGEAYNTLHNEGEQLFIYSNWYLQRFNSFGTILLTPTTPIIMIFSIVGYRHKCISLQYSLALILLCFLPSVFRSIGVGSRGGLLMSFLSFAFFFLLFRNEMSKSIKRKIILISLLILFIVSVVSWMITEQRVAGGIEGINSIVRYFGESFPNLGLQFWGQVEYHPMGERLFPGFWGNGVEDYGSQELFYQFWGGKTKVPVLIFKTFFGDMYIEFGWFWALFIIVFISLPISYYYQHNGITIYNIAFLYYYYHICMYAFAGCTFGDAYSILQVIIIFVISFILRLYVR